MPYIIRPAAPGDAAALAAIYAPYIDTAITFESPAPDAAEMARRIADTMSAYPWLVCERDGVVIGYAYAHRYRVRAAFDWTAELSIYLDMSQRGHGLGEALYGAVIELLQSQGYVVAYGIVCTPNRPSERLHEKCGFARLFTLKNCGWKLGSWRDMPYYGRQIAPLADEPAPPVPFPRLDAGYVREVCEKYAGSIKEAEK